MTATKAAATVFLSKWTLLKSTIANALKQHPTALRDVVAALKSLNVENPINVG